MSVASLAAEKKTKNTEGAKHLILPAVKTTDMRDEVMRARTKC